MSKPAARLLDMHVCPMITVLVPHVGGPIAGPGDPTTLIGGLPAARVTDMCVCVGPPDVIAMGSFTVMIGGLPAARVGDITAHGGTIMPPGCPTVMIGDAGGGAGSPQALTMGAAKAKGAAFTRTNCAVEGAMAAVKGSPLQATGDPNKKSWIEVELVDQKGKPVPHERYRVVPPDKKPIEGFLDELGLARVTGIDPGTCTISFPDLDGASWKPEKGDPGRSAVPDAPTVGRPSVGPVSLRGVFVGKPSVGPVKAVIATSTGPSVGPVRVRIAGLGVGPVTVKLVQPSTVRFVAQIPSAVRKGTVLLVRGRGGRELLRQDAPAPGKNPTFLTIPLDQFLSEGRVTVEVALANGKILNGFAIDLNALSDLRQAGATLAGFAKQLGLDLSPGINPNAGQ